MLLGRLTRRQVAVERRRISRRFISLFFIDSLVCASREFIYPCWNTNIVKVVLCIHISLHDTVSLTALRRHLLNILGQHPGVSSGLKPSSLESTNARLRVHLYTSTEVVRNSL